MRIEDIEIGMRVVPFQKTAQGFERNFQLWKEKRSPVPRFFLGKGYLVVKSLEFGNCYGLGNEDSDDSGADYFNACDFEPFIEFEYSNFWEYYYSNKETNSLLEIKESLLELDNQNVIFKEQLKAVEKIILWRAQK